MRFDLDKQIIGFVVGIIIPILTSFLIFKTRYHGGESYIYFVTVLFKVHSVGKLLSLSVLPNLLFFFLAVWSERLKSARGVLIATVFYSIIGLFLFLAA